MTKKLFHVLLLLGVLSLVSACGTMRTIGKGPISSPPKHLLGSQPCKTIKRWYSGIRYNSCVLFDGDGSDWELEGYLWPDLPFSFILDTFVLPYTIYMQAAHGDVKQEYKD